MVNDQTHLDGVFAALALRVLKTDVCVALLYYGCQWLRIVVSTSSTRGAGLSISSWRAQSSSIL